MKCRIAAAMTALVTVFIASSHVTAARGAQAVPYLPVPHDAAVILNSGSTNFAGYRIVIQRSGGVEYVHGSDRRTASLPASLAERFFADAQRGMPLSRLPVLACMKSASFGSETYAWWRGQRSPDLSCPGNAAANALMQDIGAIASALGLAGGSPTPPPSEPRKPLH